MDEKNEAPFRFRWPLVIALALVFTGIILYRTSYNLSAIKADTAETAVPVPITPATTMAEKEKIDLQPLEQKQAPSAPVITEATPRIEAICISGSGKSSVYVRGDFAYEGDIVDGFKILKIYPDKVEFEKDGKTVTAVFPRP
jgi:hypothetical protein